MNFQYFESIYLIMPLHASIWKKCQILLFIRVFRTVQKSYSIINRLRMFIFINSFVKFFIKVGFIFVSHYINFFNHIWYWLIIPHHLVLHIFMCVVMINLGLCVPRRVRIGHRWVIPLSPLGLEIGEIACEITL